MSRLPSPIHKREIAERSNSSFVKGELEQPEIFAQRFLRIYRLLTFIACRVLGDEERAPIAVQNCLRIASRNPQRFEYEGAFRSWLVRVLIDEAVALLPGSHEPKDTTAAAVNAVSSSNSTMKPELG